MYELPHTTSTVENTCSKLPSCGYLKTLSSFCLAPETMRGFRQQQTEHVLDLPEWADFFFISSSKIQVFSVTYLCLPLKRDDPFCDPVNLGGPMSVENGYLLLSRVAVIVDSSP